MGKLSNISPYKGDGTTPLLQKWLDILYTALRGDLITDTDINITKLGTVVDLTSATSDYELSVGETAKITITAASTALNIAVEDGVYEIRAVFDFTTFAADSSFRILINNAAQTGAVTRIRLRAATDIATDEVDVADTAVDSHFDIISTRIVQVTGTITIMGAVSTAIGSIWGVNVGNVEQISVGGTHWAGTHTSLGTISLDEAATGICYVKRIA